MKSKSNHPWSSLEGTIKGATFNNIQDMSEYVSKLYQLIERQQKLTKLSEGFGTTITNPTDIHNLFAILGGDPRVELNSVNEALKEGIKLIQHDLVIGEDNLATQVMSISTNTVKLNKNKVILEQMQKEITNIESEGRELKLKVSSKTKDNKFKQEKYHMQCESNKHMLDNMSAKQTSFILQKSIEQNNHEFVKIFINKDFNPNFQNANGESLLHTAVKLKDAIITQENQLLKKVIAKNPDKNLKDKDGNTALLLAVKAQDFYLMDKLMTPEGLYVSNLNDESPFTILETQLFNAVDSNNIEFIQKLSLIVPDYSRFSQNEKPLLYAALEQNKLEIAKLFLAGLSAEQTLLTAVQLSNIEVVQKLFTLIDTIDFHTMGGQEIISTASTEQNLELIELLNTMGAEIPLSGEYLPYNT